MTNGRNNNNFKMPKNRNLPFFAYGLFQPGKNHYSKIKVFIKQVKNEEVNYRSIKKDGVPMLMRIHDNNYKTSGHMINFNDNENAYKEIIVIINKSHLSDKFIWDTIVIGRKKCNALFFKGPEDINLPFFTYGIFKPGEIAYSKIKDSIINKDKKVIHYPMRHRDGVPILLSRNKPSSTTCGYLFNFNDNEEAYKIINETIPYELYYWDTIDIGKDKVNVLFGNRPFDGSNEIVDPDDKRNFKGIKDPVFKKGMELIRNYLESEFSSDERDEDEEIRFFNLQMHYMFLWSAIDRYCKLRYNRNTDWANREELLKEDLFKKALLNLPNVNRHYRQIFTTDDLTERRFNINEPKWCMNYFYTLRCNIVHRLKTNGWDIDLLKQATWDLLDIMEDILNETFNEK